MATENATSITELDPLRPVHASDPVGEADDHLRQEKLVLKNTFADQPGDAWDDQGYLTVGPRQINGWEARIATTETTLPNKADTTYVDAQDAANLSVANAYADGQDAIVLNNAEGYTDSHAAETASTNDVHGTRTYADAGDAATLVSANAYTDANSLSVEIIPGGYRIGTMQYQSGVETLVSQPDTFSYPTAFGAPPDVVLTGIGTPGSGFNVMLDAVPTATSFRVTNFDAFNSQVSWIAIGPAP